MLKYKQPYYIITKHSEKATTKICKTVHAKNDTATDNINHSTDT